MRFWFPVLAIALVWTWATLNHMDQLGLPLAMAEFWAASGIMLSLIKMPRWVWGELRTMALGLVFIGLGELVLAIDRAFPTININFYEYFFLAGGILILVGSIRLPLKIQAIGLFSLHNIRTILGVSTGVAIISTVLLVSGRPTMPFIIFYTFAEIFLMLIFAMQVPLARKIRLKLGFKRFMWGFACVALGRLIGIFSGSHPSATELQL